TDRDIAQNHTSAADRCSSLDKSRLDSPVRLSLKLPVFVGRSGIAIIDKDNVVPDEHAILQYHSFTNEGVTGDFAVRPDLCTLLYFDESPNLAAIPNLTTVQIDKLINLDVLAELHVWGYALSF